MSATRSQWALMIERVMQLIYEQDDNYMGQSYEQAKPEINYCISQWRVVDLESYIRENFPTGNADQTQDLYTVCDSARIACISQL